MPVILGRHFLATSHAKVDVFRKTISLEVGNEKVIFKMRSNFFDNIHESVRVIKTKMNMEEDELMKIDSNLFTYNTDACEIKHLLSIDPDVFTYDIEVQESYKEIVYTCSLIAKEANGGLSKDFKDPDGCGESKENKILGTIIKSYMINGSREREVYTKIKVLEVKELSRTRGNIATIRAGIMEEIFGNDDEKESYDETFQQLGGNFRHRLDPYFCGRFADLASVTT
nr:hypothetical protein [Tanacetum cinerariifolium]GFA88090.1 hypothetical protein [Tanacetum cinerariifolium]GFA95252.1 hypothetical protein [Tanacetum cinerariifolium]